MKVYWVAMWLHLARKILSVGCQPLAKELVIYVCCKLPEPVGPDHRGLPTCNVAEEFYV
jgi:hypothetical protein